jgi:hypothetical protein
MTIVLHSTKTYNNCMKNTIMLQITYGIVMNLVSKLVIMVEEGFLQKKGSHYVYGLIPKAHEWMLVLACFNAIGPKHTFLVFTFSKAIVACIIT